MHKLSFYMIDEKYIKYISKFDNKIAKTYGVKARRPYVGIILIVNNTYFFAPFTSPKEKHLSMKNTVDFLKINNGIWGAINFNNMIPIPKNSCKIINIIEEKDPRYKALLYNQLEWCNRKNNVIIIKSKANNLYQKFISKKLPKNILDRCCNFSDLIYRCNEYEKND